AEDGIRDATVTGVQTCALPISLNGGVNPQGVPTTYQFQYGVTAGYGGGAPGTPVALGAGTAAIAVSANVRVAPGTTYHYKLTARSEERRVGKECGTSGQATPEE